MNVSFNLFFVIVLKWGVFGVGLATTISQIVSAYFVVRCLIKDEGSIRGHGKSPRGDRPFTIRQFAEDMKNFMDRHKIEKAHILGFSDGGNIALCFALKYPERIDGK